MGAWDDEESEEEVALPTRAPAVKRRFEGEDEEVADDWEASSDKDQGPPPTTSIAPPKRKGTLKAAIAAREAERARRVADGELTDDESEVDEAEQKRRDKQRELETDLSNATSLLSGSSIKGKAAAVEGILTLDPKSKEEFQLLSDRLIELIKRHQDKPLYAMFVEMHVKALAAPLKDVDVRKVASGLTALANEKQKEQREKASGKKKPKAAVKPALTGLKASSKVDMNAYNEALDDFGDDDFM